MPSETRAQDAILSRKEFENRFFMSHAIEILRMVDTIHRDKEIDKEVIFQAIEAM